MTFDAQVQTLTQDEIVPVVVDQTLVGNVMGLLTISQGKKWAGESMKFPVKLGSHTQGGSFNDYGPGFQTANENVRVMSSFDARAYYQSVVIGGIARSINGISKTRLLDLVKVEMESCHQDMADDIGSLGYGDGTGNSSKDFLGTDAAIDDGTTIDTYGSISRTTYPAWKSTIQTSTGAWDFSKARTLWNSATVGMQHPTVATCNETTYGYIEADYTATVDGNYQVVNSQRAVLNSQGIRPPEQQQGLVGQAGFAVLFFDGTPIIRDDKQDSQKLTAFNLPMYRWYGVPASESEAVDLKSVYHEGNDYKRVPSSLGFNWTGFVRPADQFSWIGQLLLIGNWVTPSPRLHSSSAGISS